MYIEGIRMESVAGFVRIKEWVHILGLPAMGYLSSSKSFILGYNFYLLIVLSFFALAFAYSFNEYFDNKGKYRRSACYLSVSMLIASLSAAILISFVAFLLTLLGAALAISYSHSRIFLKSRPLVGTFVNSISFADLFLIGAATYSGIALESLLMSVLIAFVSVPFQVIHEIGHVASDRRRGLATTVSKLGNEKSVLIANISLAFSVVAAFLVYVFFKNVYTPVFTVSLSAALFWILRMENPFIARIYMRYCGIAYGILMVLGYIS